MQDTQLRGKIQCPQEQLFTINKYSGSPAFLWAIPGDEWLCLLLGKSNRIEPPVATELSHIGFFFCLSPSPILISATWNHLPNKLFTWMPLCPTVLSGKPSLFRAACLKWDTHWISHGKITTWSSYTRIELFDIWEQWLGWEELAFPRPLFLIACCS